MTTTPLTVLDLVPISSGSNARPGAAQQHRPGPADRTARLHPLLVRRAPPQPRRGRHLAGRGAGADRRRDVDDPARLGRRCRWGTAPPCRRSRSSACSTPCTRAGFDLGLGRSGGRPREPKAPALAGGGAAATVGQRPDRRTGCSSRPGSIIRPLLGSPRFALQKTLLQLPHAEPQNYTEQVGDVLALIAGTYRSAEGEEAHVVPGEGAALQVWILGSSGGESAEVAGAQRPAVRRQLPRQPGHRARGGRRLPGRVPAFGGARPALRQRLGRRRGGRRPRPRPASWPPATGCGCAASAPPRAPSSSPPRSRPGRHVWSDDDRELVADRIDTQFVGTPGQVADQLERLRDATGADELIVTTITHDHADRVRSYELLAEEWARR